MEIMIEQMETKEYQIKRYPEEPHSDNEHGWKNWWIKKCFNPNDTLTEGAMKWIHDCWITTKVNWTNEKYNK